MPDARFKDLVIDVADVTRLGRFWADALGLDPSPAGAGDLVLRDSVPEHAVWINAVPEVRSVKQRVHLDLLDTPLSLLESLGARFGAAQQRWTVMHDPEGGEFCVVHRAGPNTAYRVQKLVVDALDPEAVATWWGDRFGLRAAADPSRPRWRLEGGEESGLPWPMVFDRVPEPKQVKNRIHWDVWGEVEALLAAGAGLLRRQDQEIRWSVLADPEGNEFCVFAPTS